MVRIGDSLVLLSGMGERESLPAFLYVYVDDVFRNERHASPRVLVPRGWRRVERPLLGRQPDDIREPGFGGGGVESRVDVEAVGDE